MSGAGVDAEREDADKTFEPEMVTVVLADEQPVVRNGLRAMLSRSRNVTVAAEAATAHDALRLAVLHRPDVLVVDIELLGLGVGARIREVLRGTPSTAVLVFTAVDDEETMVSAMRAGARGYLLKHSSDDGVLLAVRGLAMGEAVLGPSVADRIVNRIDNCQERHGVLFPDLTTREREVLELMVLGMRNGTIAANLRLSPKTVANHVSRIFGKLQVADRAEAIGLWLGSSGSAVPTG
ncbi:LuxR C-terminal-related transcriptional regulator [Amycolatopsis sp. NPDC051758]|uniref:LuxR C-terminal-related transcriptional regulator n=1 Tax=Amycolatopsis sp. NPDC051758 TaxID=3363935 RepID=UPI0037A1E130